MGVVFEATHQELSPRVAIEVIQPGAVGHAAFMIRFEPLIASVFEPDR